MAFSHRSTSMASEKRMYGRSSIVLQTLFYVWGSAQQNKNGTWNLKLAGFCRVDSSSRTFISSVDKQMHHTEVHTNSGYGAAAGACSHKGITICHNHFRKGVAETLLIGRINRGARRHSCNPRRHDIHHVR